MTGKPHKYFYNWSVCTDLNWAFEAFGVTLALCDHNKIQWTTFLLLKIILRSVLKISQFYSWFEWCYSAKKLLPHQSVNRPLLTVAKLLFKLLCGKFKKPRVYWSILIQNNILMLKASGTKEEYTITMGWVFLFGNILRTHKHILLKNHIFFQTGYEV